MFRSLEVGTVVQVLTRYLPIYGTVVGGIDSLCLRLDIKINLSVMLLLIVGCSASFLEPASRLAPYRRQFAVSNRRPVVVCGAGPASASPTGFVQTEMRGELPFVLSTEGEEETNCHDACLYAQVLR